VDRRLPVCVLSLVVSSCVIGKDAAITPASGTASDRQNQRGPHFASERRWGARTDIRWEPVVAADRNSKWIYQMTTAQRPNYLLFRASSDSGRTWSAPRHICRHGTPGIPFQFDPQLTVASTGVVDAICLNGFSPGVVFTQSLDHGQTWSATVRLDGSLRYSDKPTLAVSPSGTDVYVAFNVRYALYVAASHDGGTTWSPPIRATSAHLWYYSYGGTVARDGSVWFAVDGEDGRDQTGNGYVGLVTSSDGGTTWRAISFAVSHEGAPCYGHNCYPDFYTAQDAVAVNREGAFVFVYAKNSRKQGPNALYVTRSNDGVRWSVPSVVNTLGNSTSPAIVAGEDAGDFRLVWQDNRNGSKAWNTWFARTTDGGLSWSDPVRLSDRGSGAPYKRSAGYDFPFGDYLGLSVDSQGADFVIWGEGEHVYYPGGTWWTHD